MLEEKGYITIETSLVMTMVLGVLALLLLGSMLIHDGLVSKSYHRLRAEAYVLQAKDPLSVRPFTFLMDPIYQTTRKKTLVGEGGLISVQASYKFHTFRLGADVESQIESAPINQKNFIRFIDLVDDITTLIPAAATFKENQQEGLKKLVELVITD